MDKEKKAYDKPTLAVVKLPPCQLLADSDVSSTSEIDPWNEGSSGNGSVDF